MNSFIIHDWVNQSLKLCLYILDESSIIQNRWYNKVYSCVKHIQSLLVIIIACMTLGSCSNELDVTKSFPFTVETMPVPKELSQGETIEIRCTLTCPADYSGTQYTIRYFQYDGDGILRMGKNGEPFIPNDRYPVEKGDFRLYYTSQSTEQQSLEIVFEDNMGHSQVVEFDFNNKRE